MFICCSCGHSVQSAAKGIGIEFSWNGQSYVPNIRLGYYDVNTAVVRGNTTFTTTTSSGGSIVGSGGTQTTTQMSAGVQLNQGYLADVLTSPNNSDQVKRDVIKYTMTTKNPEAIPTVSKTSIAAGGTGAKPPQVEPVYTGMDKVVDTAGNVAVKVGPTLVKETGKTTRSVANTTGDTVKSVTKDTTHAVEKVVEDTTNTVNNTVSSIKIILALACVILLLLIIIGVVFFIIYKRKKYII